jgi:hypothetical protein
VTRPDHEAFLREVAEAQERLAIDLERVGSAEYARRAWRRAAAARERAEAAHRRVEQIASSAHREGVRHGSGRIGH